MAFLPTEHKKPVFILWALLIAGCDSTGHITPDRLEQAMQPFRDKPIDKLITVLGPPTEERSISGRRVPVWINNSHEAHELKIPDCTLFILADEGNIIRGWDHTGSTDSCVILADKLTGKKPTH